MTVAPAHDTHRAAVTTAATTTDNLMRIPLANATTSRTQPTAATSEIETAACVVTTWNQVRLVSHRIRTRGETHRICFPHDEQRRTPNPIWWSRPKLQRFFRLGVVL